MDSRLGRRLDAQRITRADASTARDVVAWLGAVQAQDYLASKWAVGLRMRSATDTDVERAVNDGSIVRTHAFRGTWQYMAPEDVRWMIDLVGQRVIKRAASRHAELGLDPKTLVRAGDAIAKALERGPLVRAELATVLRRAKIAPDGQRLPHILGWAELQSILCGGPRRGKQHTWMLLDDRVPSSKPLPREEALSLLALRYFRSRGPATVDDFIWWTGLPAAEARAAHASVRAALRDAPAPRIRSPSAFLLPAFDEYLIAYADRSAMIAARHVPKLDPRGGMLEPVIVLDGKVIGGWSRTLQNETVTIRLRLFVRPSKAERRAIDAAMDRYAHFLGRARS